MAFSCQLSLGTTSAEENCFAQGHRGRSTHKGWSKLGTDEFLAPYSNQGSGREAFQLQTTPWGHVRPSWDWSASPFALFLPHMLTPKAVLVCTNLCLKSLTWRGHKQRLLRGRGDTAVSLPNCRFSGRGKSLPIACKIGVLWFLDWTS